MQKAAAAAAVAVVLVVTHNYLLLPLELPTDNNLNVHTAPSPLHHLRVSCPVSIQSHNSQTLGSILHSYRKAK
jgi:hypothetical protein